MKYTPMMLLTDRPNLANEKWLGVLAEGLHMVHQASAFEEKAERIRLLADEFGMPNSERKDMRITLQWLGRLLATMSGFVRLQKSGLQPGDTVLLQGVRRTVITIRKDFLLRLEGVPGAFSPDSLVKA